MFRSILLLALLAAAGCRTAPVAAPHVRPEREASVEVEVPAARPAGAKVVVKVSTKF